MCIQKLPFLVELFRTKVKVRKMSAYFLRKLCRWFIDKNWKIWRNILTFPSFHLPIFSSSFIQVFVPSASSSIFVEEIWDEENIRERINKPHIRKNLIKFFLSTFLGSSSELHTKCTKYEIYRCLIEVKDWLCYRGVEYSLLWSDNLSFGLEGLQRVGVTCCKKIVKMVWHVACDISGELLWHFGRANVTFRES